MLKDQKYTSGPSILDFSFLSYTFPFIQAFFFIL